MQYDEFLARAAMVAATGREVIERSVFVHRVAEREDELDQIAREHARAVLTTVREAVTADEWRDTVAELPRDYQKLL